MNKNVQRGLVLVGSMIVAGAAFAQQAGGPDLSSLTGTVVMDTVKTAVLAVSATLAGVFVVIRGSKIVIGLIRGR